MSPGRPTLGDVARQAGVHKATASRALNSATAGRVNAATAARVRQAAQELGYRPNVNARGLRLQSTLSIGVLIPNVLSQLYPPLIHGIERTLRRHDYFALVADSENDAAQEAKALDNLLSRQVDGLIAATHRSSRPLVFDVASHGLPVVFLEEARGQPGLSSVATDNASGVDGLADLLVGLGHRRIAHLAGPDTGGDGPERIVMHRRAFTRHGLDPSEYGLDHIAGDYTVEAGYAAATRLLADRPDVTAVMAYNDLVAIGAMRAVRAAGLRCPEDVSVTGFNDVPLVDSLTPALTTARLDTTRQGRDAAEILMKAISDPTVEEHRTLPVQVQARGSHGPVRPGG